MTLSRATLDNKCTELELRMQWPAGSIRWATVTDPAGNPFGIRLDLAQPIGAAVLTPHVQVTFPLVGQMILRRRGEGAELLIPALSCDMEEGGGA